MKKHLLCFLRLGLVPVTLLLLSALAQGQTDSSGSPLLMQQLSSDDILQPTGEKQEVVSSGRVARDIRDISYSIHVITRQEILDNGYNTLVDVLKDVPGIKVSQPGSAIDGESFMMRGFYGNYYTKILINSLPITPSARAGMSIGAQLPIKQAERIEVIFGPAAAIYGADAMAGVVNIITKKPDKAVFAQADLSSGGLGLGNLNAMVGGKAGQGRNILNYNLWGGYLAADDLRVKYDQDHNYNPLTYDANAAFLQNPNYEGSVDSIGMSQLPIASQYFGADLSFRNFRASYQYLYREAHSSIGLQPLVAAYDDPTRYFGEEIQRGLLSYKARKSKVSFTTNLNWLNFRMDPQSHYYSIQNFQHGEENYYYAASDDLYAEQLVAWSPNQQFSLVGGASFQYSGNLPFTSYLLSPFDADDYSMFSTKQLSSQTGTLETNLPRTGPVDQEVLLPNPITFYQYSSFAEFSTTQDRWSGQLGMRYDFNSVYGSGLNPRIAGLYKFNNNHILRASISQSSKIPSSFFWYNSLAWDTVSTKDDPQYVPVVNDSLNAETLLTGEIGMRNYFGKNISWDVSVYYNEVSDQVSYNVVENNALAGNGTARIADFVGYISDEEAFSTLVGLQSNLTVKELIPAVHLQSDFYLTLASGIYQLPFKNGELDGWPMQPAWMGKVNFQLNPIPGKDKWWLALKSTFSDSWISRNTYTQEAFESDPNLELPGFYTLDVITRYKVNKNFQAYLKVVNVFNSPYAGIAATGTVFDLKYNPQMGRFFEYGFSFRFD